MKVVGRVAMAVAYVIMALLMVWFVASWANVVATNGYDDGLTVASWNLFSLLLAIFG